MRSGIDMGLEMPMLLKLVGVWSGLGQRGFEGRCGWVGEATGD